MAEIAGAEFQAALFVGETPATGVVGAIAGDGTVKVLEAWDPVQGDVTHTAPAGSAGGGGTRRHLFDREVYVDSTGLGAYVNVRAWASITGKPTTVGGYGITDAITTAGGQTIAGTLNTSGAVTINTNATYFTGKTAGAVAKRLIGVNAGGLVSIDTDAVGATFGAGVVVAGAITTGTDAANDLGAGSFRFRAGFFSGAVTAGSLALSGAISGATTGTFSGQVLGNASGGDISAAFKASAAAPAYSWNTTGAALNEKVWDIVTVGTSMFFRTAVDAGGSNVTWMQATRSGTSVSTLTVSAATLAVLALTATGFLSKSDLATYSEPSAQVRAVGSTDPNKQVVMGINTTANVGFIQAVQFGTGNFELRLNPNGGTVTVGSSLQPVTDNASDLGTGSFRWRAGFFSGAVQVSTLTGTGAGSSFGNTAADPLVRIVRSDNTLGNVATLQFGTNNGAFFGQNAFIRGKQGTGIDQWTLEMGGTAAVFLSLTTTGAVIAGTMGATGNSSFTGNGNAVNLLNFFDTDSGAHTNLAVSFLRNGSQVGSISTTLAATAFNTSSDERLKNDRGIATNADVLRGIVIHEFTWKVDGTEDRGVFAQEAYKVPGISPHAVYVGDDERPWGFDYSKMVPDIIVGWQEHDARIAQLERENAELRARLAPAA